jgi:two-component system, OmpR family, sensor histidine kinase VicK
LFEEKEEEEEEEEEEIKTKVDVEKTEILYGSDKIVKRAIEDFHKIKDRFDNCTDSTGPSAFFNSPILKEFVNLANRGIKLRFITKITKDNIPYCKELMNITELRHLDGVKGNFGISDGENYIGAARVKEGQTPVEIMRSNVRTFVEQQQFFFETLWSKSIPAEQKIKEIEEGIEQIKTQVLQNPQDIFKSTIEFYNKSNWIKSYFPVEGINIIYRDFSNSRQEILERYRQGKHKGIRWITSLKNEKDVDLVKSYSDNGINIRHVKDLLTHSFALSDKSFLFTIEKVKEGGKLITNVISSNDKLCLDHYDDIFENLWKKGIDIQDRIKEIEEGYSFNIEMILNPIESLKFYKESLQTIKKEILIMLASSSGFFRIEKNIRYDTLEKLAYKDIKVKILFPMKMSLEHKINKLKAKYPKIDFGILHNSLESSIGLTIIDKQRVLITEVKDDVKSKYTDAIGATICIEGKSTAISYATIFNGLWKQTEIYEKLEKSFETIQSHEKIQRDFINIAAHELRTPIQPILGFTQHLKNKITDKEQLGYLDVIDRNTKRLKKLAEDILEISKIENNLFGINKEHFKIKEIIHQLICDYKREIETKNIELEFTNPLINDDLIIYADKEKICQAISNLISNSIKFIPYEKEGKIFITLKKSKDDQNNDYDHNTYINNHMIIVTVKDNGMGIDKDILPMLFTKFASKSFQGTGLGLYISKKIIEAHGGKIWAKNNEDGKGGATFIFSLPLDN